MQDITATKSKTWQAAQSLSDMAGRIFIGYQTQEDSNTSMSVAILCRRTIPHVFWSVSLLGRWSNLPDLDDETENASVGAHLAWRFCAIAVASPRLLRLLVEFGNTP